MKHIHKKLRHKEIEQLELRKITIQRALKKIIISLVFVMLFWFFIGGNLGIFAMWQSSRYVKHLEKMVEDEEQYSVQLDEQIQKFYTDTLYIEQVARTKFGMVKNGEVVFVFADNDSTSNNNN